MKTFYYIYHTKITKSSKVLLVIVRALEKRGKMGFLWLWAI